MPQPDKKRSSSRQRYASDKNVPIFGQQQQQAQQLQAPELFIETPIQGSGAAPVTYSFGNLAPRSPDQDKFQGLQEIVSGAQKSVDFFSRFMNQLDKDNQKELQKHWNDAGAQRTITELDDAGNSVKFVLDTADAETIESYQSINQTRLDAGMAPMYNIQKETPQQRVARFRKSSETIKGRGFNFGLQRDSIITEFAPEVERDYAQKVSNRAELIVKSNELTASQKIKQLTTLKAGAPQDVAANISVLLSGIESQVQKDANTARVSEQSATLVRGIKSLVGEYERTQSDEVANQLLDPNAPWSDAQLFETFDITDDLQGVVGEFMHMTPEQQTDALKDLDEFSRANFAAIMDIRTSRDALLENFRVSQTDNIYTTAFQQANAAAQDSTDLETLAINTSSVMRLANQSSKTSGLPLAAVIADATKLSTGETIDNKINPEILEEARKNPLNPVQFISDPDEYVDNVVDIVASNIVGAYDIRVKLSPEDKEQMMVEVRTGVKASMEKGLRSHFAAVSAPPEVVINVQKNTPTIQIAAGGTATIFSKAGLNVTAIKNGGLGELRPVLESRGFDEFVDDDDTSMLDVFTNIFDSAMEKNFTDIDDENEALMFMREQLTKLVGAEDAETAINEGLKFVEQNYRMKMRATDSYSKENDDLTRAAERHVADMSKVTPATIAEGMQNSQADDVSLGIARFIMSNSDDAAAGNSLIPTKRDESGATTREQYFSVDTPTITIGDQRVNPDDHESRPGERMLAGDMLYLSSFYEDGQRIIAGIENRAEGEPVDLTELQEFVERSGLPASLDDLATFRSFMGNIAKAQAAVQDGRILDGGPERYEVFGKTGDPRLTQEDYVAVVKGLNNLQELHERSGQLSTEELSVFKTQKEYLQWLLNPSRELNLESLGYHAGTNPYILKHLTLTMAELADSVFGTPDLSVPPVLTEDHPTLKRALKKAFEEGDYKRAQFLEPLVEQDGVVTSTSADRKGAARVMFSTWSRLLSGVKNYDEFMNLDPEAKTRLLGVADAMISNLYVAGNPGEIPQFDTNGNVLPQTGFVLKPLMLEVVRSDLQLQGITEPSLQEIYTRFSELVHSGDLVDATVSYHGKIMGADSPGEIRATFALPALLLQFDAKGKGSGVLKQRILAGMVVAGNDTGTFTIGDEDSYSAPFMQNDLFAPIFLDGEGQVVDISPGAQGTRVDVATVQRVQLPGFPAETFISGDDYRKILVYSLAESTARLGGVTTFDSDTGADTFTTPNMAALYGIKNPTIGDLHIMTSEQRRRLQAGEKFQSTKIDAQGGITKEFAIILDATAKKINDLNAASAGSGFEWARTTYGSMAQLSSTNYTTNPLTGKVEGIQDRGRTRGADALISVMRMPEGSNPNDVWNIVNLLPNYNTAPGSFGGALNDSIGNAGAVTHQYTRQISKSSETQVDGQPVSTSNVLVRTRDGVSPGSASLTLNNPDPWVASTTTYPRFSGEYRDEDRMSISEFGNLSRPIPSDFRDGKLKDGADGYNFDELPKAARAQRLSNYSRGVSESWIRAIDGSDALTTGNPLLRAVSEVVYDATSSISQDQFTGNETGLSVLDLQLFSAYAILDSKDQILERLTESGPNPGAGVRGTEIKTRRREQAEQFFIGLASRLEAFEANLVSQEQFERPSFTLSADGKVGSKLGYLRPKGRAKVQRKYPLGQPMNINTVHNGQMAQWNSLSSSHIDPLGGYYGMELFTSDGETGVVIPLYLRSFQVPNAADFQRSAQ
jgi:hypothetical protein